MFSVTSGVSAHSILFRSFGQPVTCGVVLCKAREVKTVTVDATAHFLKLLIHRPHSTELNAGGQVGLVQLLTAGKVEAPAPYGGEWKPWPAFDCRTLLRRAWHRRNTA